MASKISNFITKLLLGLLLILMIAGVAVWGVNDIMVGSNNKTIARVGNSKISDFELQNVVQNNKLRMMQSGLTNMSEEFTTVIRNNALVNLIGDRLLQNEFAHLNLQLDGKEVLKKDYLSQPDFNKEQLASYAKSQGGEEAFIRKIIKEKKIDILQGSLTAITPVNDRAVRSLYDFENQTKKIQYLELSPSIVKDSGDSTEEELKNFYETYKDKFLTPEYRSASYVVIDKSVVGKISESEDEVDRLHEISGEILDKVAGGATLEELAKQYNLTISKIDSIDSNGINKDGGKVDNLPKVENFVPAIFGTEQGEISDLIEAGDAKTYALVRTDSITEKRIKSLDEVRGIAVEGLKTQKRSGKLVDIVKKLKEDLDAGKTTLEQFASTNGIAVKETDVKLKSKDFTPEFVTEVMNLQKGAYSNLTRNKDNQLIIARVSGVVKAGEPSDLDLFQYKSKVQDQVSQELMAQYLDYLKQKYNVTVY